MGIWRKGAVIPVEPEDKVPSSRKIETKRNSSSHIRFRRPRYPDLNLSRWNDQKLFQRGGKWTPNWKKRISLTFQAIFKVVVSFESSWQVLSTIRRWLLKVKNGKSCEAWKISVWGAWVHLGNICSRKPLKNGLIFPHFTAFDRPCQELSDKPKNLKIRHEIQIFCRLQAFWEYCLLFAFLFTKTTLSWFLRQKLFKTFPTTPRTLTSEQSVERYEQK